MRSLVRLFLGAVLLCLAWVVLTSGHASAAERTEPARRPVGLSLAIPSLDRPAVDDVVRGLLSRAPRATRPAAPGAPAAGASSGAVRPSTQQAKPRHESRSYATPSATSPILSQPVGEVATTLGPALDAGLDLVGDVAAVAEPVPVVGRALVDVTDSVESLVRSLPVLGEPSPIVPLPIGGGIVFGDPPGPATLPTETVAAEGVHRIPRALEATPRADAMRPGGVAAAVPGMPDAGAAGTARPGAPSVPTSPTAPLDAVPAPPSQPSPGGSGPGASDPVTASDQMSLGGPGSLSRTAADWRLPSGPFAQPGTRPD